MTALSPQQERLLSCFPSEPLFASAYIVQIYTTLRGCAPTEDTTSRQMQQYVSAHVHKLNAKWEKMGDRRRIVPGDMKRTYRLVHR